MRIVIVKRPSYICKKGVLMKTVLFFTAMLTFRTVFCQVNLVPNNSFEFFSICPTVNDNIDLAYPWIDPINTGPEYFDSCSATMNVPGSTAFYQVADEGSAYAGFYAYSFAFPNYREYIECPLIDTLKANSKYCVSFKVSLADSFQYSVCCLSTYFSENGGGINATQYFSYLPQVNSSVMLSDKNNWIEVNNYFTATGNERYITIGNFNTDAFTNIQYVGGSSTDGIPYDWRHSYYLIDNVSVIEIVEIKTVNDTMICKNDSINIGTNGFPGVQYAWQPAIGLSNPNTANPKASPNTTTTYTLTQTQCSYTQTATVIVTVDENCGITIPTLLYSNQLLTISRLQPGSQLEIYDLRGRTFFKTDNYLNDFPVALLAAGVYVVRLSMPDGTVVQQQVVVL